MSDAGVLRLIEEMEALLLDEATPPAAEALDRWQRAFEAEAAGAERGPGWPGLVQRAHALAGRIDVRIGALNLQKAAIRKELEDQATGQRALKGYRVQQP
jgi:hypothetical protein